MVLTPREYDVLKLVADGHENKDIAKVLKISKGTVSIYLSRILLKLGANTRAHAVSLAIKDGLI